MKAGLCEMTRDLTASADNRWTSLSLHSWLSSSSLK